MVTFSTFALPTQVANYVGTPCVPLNLLRLTLDSKTSALIDSERSAKLEAQRSFPFPECLVTHSVEFRRSRSIAAEGRRPGR